jgi:hypothetical protein
MSLSAESKELLLTNLYYSPTTQYTSIKNLYDNVKKKGITYNEVRQFLQKQESNQLFKKKTKMRHYFPTTSKFKFEILQADLVDMSDISVANQNYKYLLVCIDVFSRFAFVKPMKNKKSETVTEVIKDIIENTKPYIINTDLGSEFISDAFRKLMSTHGTQINYVDVGEHHKLACIDRFVRTLRHKINIYLTSHNTTKYIDVLPDIVYNYNNGYHSGIKKVPAEVEEEDRDILELNNKKYIKAMIEEPVYNIGQRVRHLLNRSMFSKGTLSKWSKAVHTIVSSTLHSYILENGKSFKYYELQPINEVEKLDKNTTEPTREMMKKERTIGRRIRKEGIDMSRITTTKRQRNQTDRLKY